jgi:uncharacterized protein (DUF169 family)
MEVHDMDSQFTSVLKLIMQPVAVILTDEKPAAGLHFKKGVAFGCVGAMLVTAGKGRTVYFDRNTYGCPGGGTGLGFGDRYGRFPIDCLLSTGNKVVAAMMDVGGSEMAAGERFYRNPETARKWFNSLPLTDVPTEYVVFKPLDQVTDQDKPTLVVFFANADQLSALVVLADYNRGTNQSIAVPFGAACQSILFGYAEAEKDNPRGIIGFFDISQRRHVDRETLTFTVPYKMFQEMEACIAGSFLEMPAWRKLQERQ